VFGTVTYAATPPALVVHTGDGPTVFLKASRREMANYLVPRAASNADPEGSVARVGRGATECTGTPEHRLVGLGGFTIDP
jgi:hypothetical protein